MLRIAVKSMLSETEEQGAPVIEIEDFSERVINVVINNSYLKIDQLPQELEAAKKKMCKTSLVGIGYDPDILQKI